MLRDAMRPFDTVGDTYRQPGLGARRPSRIHAIEELPIALAMLALSRGDFLDAMFGGVNYGRDSDSIASMAGAIAGALTGAAGVDQDLLDRVSEASKSDLVQPALDLADATVDIRRHDAVMHAELAARNASLFEPAAT